MREAYPREIQRYRTPSGSEPFTEWVESIRDQRTQDRILARIESIESGGNFGDCTPIRGSGGVFELRFHFGPGYRIYFGEVDNTIVLLLCGGAKSSQARDIARAKNYWREYKETQR